MSKNLIRVKEIDNIKKEIKTVRSIRQKKTSINAHIKKKSTEMVDKYREILRKESKYF